MQTDTLFSEADIKQIEARGSDIKEVERQLANFGKGFPYIKLKRPATTGDGILNPGEEEAKAKQEHFDGKSDDNKLLKFVPASGAASRMFKALFAFTGDHKDKSGQEQEEALNNDKAVKTFFENISHFAFYQDLKAILKDKGQPSAEELLNNKNYVKILEFLLEDHGLGYGRLPKGLLKFHLYEGHARTPTEEHLVEGALYCKSQNKSNIHFTVSPEHKKEFQEHIASHKNQYEKKFDVSYHIDYSEQKPSTDTIAVDMDNQPFRNEDGSILFRPGGHGALLENLNDINADIIFIKNIDNVVPDRIKEPTIHNKKVLGGILLNYRDKIFEFLRKLEDKSKADEGLIADARQLLEQDLCHEPAENLDAKSRNEQIDYLFNKLNRPLRVCGMVRNEGETGGGPFWAENQDGSVSLQIVETAQINMEDPEQKNIVENSTHFNPVDIVCATKDYKGNKFDLKQFRDPDTGFISKKSKDGKELKAQELPGLWNGSMAEWNTIFVEVPVVTFNPVKTINDLLRENHQ